MFVFVALLATLCSVEGALFALEVTGNVDGTGARLSWVTVAPGTTFSVTLTLDDSPGPAGEYLIAAAPPPTCSFTGVGSFTFSESVGETLSATGSGVTMAVDVPVISRFLFFAESGTFGASADRRIRARGLARLRPAVLRMTFSFSLGRLMTLGCLLLIFSNACLHSTAAMLLVPMATHTSAARTAKSSTFSARRTASTR